MTWTTPAFEDIKMDAEIGSYQEDHDPGRESPVVERAERAPAGVRARAATRVRSDA